MVKIKEGGIRLDNYKCIENTKYIINRVFADNNTTATLIEQRIKNIKNNVPSLELNGTMLYNIDSGSIQSKEVL